MNNNRFKLPAPELEAEIYFLTTAEGGRQGFVATNYRGQFYYNGKDWDATQEFIDQDICKLGEVVKVRLQTLSPEFHVGRFKIGQAFEIREGARVVGQGIITKILRQDFKYWDYASFHDNLLSTCKPFDNGYIDDFIANAKYRLKTIKQVVEVKSIKSILNKNQMLTLECLTKSKDGQSRLCIGDIYQCWREKIQLEGALYKIDIKDSGSSLEFIFATWNTKFITGKIIVKVR